MSYKNADLSLETAKKLYKEGGAGKAFALDNYSEKELNPPSLPKSFRELKTISGYYITSFSYIKEISEKEYLTVNRNIFPTEKEAKAALALSQLCQLRDAYNGQPLEEWCDWTDWSSKYCIDIFNKKTERATFSRTNKILAFKTKELRDEFLENFKDLIEEAKPFL